MTDIPPITINKEYTDALGRKLTVRKIDLTANDGREIIGEIVMPDREKSRPYSTNYNTFVDLWLNQTPEWDHVGKQYG
jgi:hypothetical protein